MASWLFGSRQNPNFSHYVPPPGEEGDGGEKKQTGHSMEAYRFDSTALERAANAAKDLEKSPFAAQALQLSKAQEETKQKEVLSKAKEFEVQLEQIKLEEKRVEGDERRKTLQEQAKLDQQKAQYQDQLSRKRYEDQLMQQQRMTEENLRRQEESTAKQEAMRKATIEHELEQRHKHDMLRIKEEMKTKAEMERVNKDVHLETMKAKAAEDRETALKSLAEKRETVLASIGTGSAAIGRGIDYLLSHPVKIQAAVLGFIGLSAGYYASKGLIGTGIRFLEARLVKPDLVRETSRINLFEAIKHPVQTFRKIKRKPEDALEGVVLHPNLDARIRDIAIATKNTKFNKGTFRNILLHGPPGTGKTLFAKKLAMHSNMDYAIMTGGDVSVLGKETVTALHKVFDWATTSSKGLVLFIDEAEGFLRKRHEDLSEELRMSISAFLYRTGTETDKFIVVLASNTPEILDFAVLDRVDEPIEFPLPSFEERRRLCFLYFTKFIATPATEGKRRLKLEEFDYSEACDEVAAMTEGMSGREISNLTRDWQMTTYASKDGIFTKDIMINRTKAAVDHKKRKVSWRSEEESKKIVFSDALIQAVKKENSSKVNPKTPT